MVILRKIKSFAFDQQTEEPNIWVWLFFTIAIYGGYEVLGKLIGLGW